MLSVILVPCPPCRSVDYCVTRVVPLLRCDVCGDVQRMLSVVKRELPLILRLREMVLLCNMCMPSLETFLGIASVVKASGGDIKVSLMASWDLVEEALVKYGSKYVKKLYSHLDRLYVAFVKPEDTLVFSRVIKHKPFNLLKDLSMPMVNAISSDDISEVAKLVAHYDIERVAVVVDRSALGLAQTALRGFGMRLAERYTLALFDTYVYEDLKGRSIELITWSDDSSSALILMPSNIDEQLAKVRSAISIESTRRLVIESLCRAKWLVDLKLVVEGNEVLNSEVVKILEVIDRLRNLRKTIEVLGLSYPTVKGRISRLEKALGIRVIDSRRGGALRGETQLLDEGRVLVEVYREVLEELERQLKAALQRICSDIRDRSD